MLNDDPATQTTRYALVIFAKYPEPGKVKTRLAKDIGAQAAADLYRAFLLDLAERFSTASTDGQYDLYWACPPSEHALAEIVGADARILLQRGDELDERLYHACEDMAAVGYQRAILIGSDAPHLPASTITEALIKHGADDVVLGPAEDGGYYLIALDLQPEPPDLFRGIEMSTEHVFVQTATRAMVSGLTVAGLPRLFDVDTRDDLTRLARLLNPASGGNPALAPNTAQSLTVLGLATG